MAGYADVAKAIERLVEKTGMVGEAVAGLRSDVNGISREITELGVKVDRLDSGKASREELRSLETRQEASVRDIRAAAVMEATRGSMEWGRRLDNIDTEMEKLQDKLSALQEVRWRVVGACSVIAAGIGSGVHWIPKIFGH